MSDKAAVDLEGDDDLEDPIPADQSLTLDEGDDVLDEEDDIEYDDEDEDDDLDLDDEDDDEEVED